MVYGPPDPGGGFRPERMVWHLLILLIGYQDGGVK